LIAETVRPTRGLRARTALLFFVLIWSSGWPFGRRLCIREYYTSERFHFRLTFDVNVNGVHHIGSDVFEVTEQMHPPGIDTGNIGTTYVDGYAVTVDLGERNLLYAACNAMPGRASIFVSNGVIFGSTVLAAIPFDVFSNWRHSLKLVPNETEGHFFRAPRAGS
jgi:hypothetical protein